MSPREWPTLDPDEAMREYLRLYDADFTALGGRVPNAVDYAERFGFGMLDRHHFLVGRLSGARVLRQRVAAMLDALSQLGAGKEA